MVVEVAELLVLVDGACGRLVERQYRMAGTFKGSIRVDAEAVAIADARVQVALIDVRARIAVHWRS